MIKALLTVSCLLASGGCVVGDDGATSDSADDGSAIDGGDGDGDAALTAGLSSGVNGKACLHSPYNCKFRVEGGNAIDNAEGGLWSVADSPILDGLGHVMYPQTCDHLAFNYGQDRAFGGKTYVFARGSSNASTGWVPLDAVVSNAVLAGRIGEVNAKDTGGARMGCYQVRASHDASIAKLKVVRGDAGPEADDYLAIPRTNGKRYANLVFNLPGDALGGPAVDIFESGTRFQRIEVPTETGRPSLDVKLYALDDPNRFTGKTMKFIYGFVRTDGTQRFGWMAMDALSAVSSTPCP